MHEIKNQFSLAEHFQKKSKKRTTEQTRLSHERPPSSKHNQHHLNGVSAAIQFFSIKNTFFFSFVLEMKPATSVGWLVTQNFVRKKFVDVILRKNYATSASCPHLVDLEENVVANSGNKVKPYCEVPGPKPFPLVGNSWR